MRHTRHVAEDDPRRTPLWAVVKYIRTHRPAIFILENVRAFAASEQFRRLMCRPMAAKRA
eukprot:scaffold267539_cov32-Tisochrysis_lutea.AAC.1